MHTGGLSTSHARVKADIGLSIGVAATGIALPIVLSFPLQSFASAAPLQAFAAGAALCSTSLGTIFSLLSSSQLVSTRLGTVLTSAALIDDVVGLVMIQVISNLGPSISSFSAVTIVRPVAVSVGFIAVLIVICRWVIKPLHSYVTRNRGKRIFRQLTLQNLLDHQIATPIIHTLILLGLVTGASYAGTSNIFAAYLAGAFISWCDSELLHSERTDGSPPTIIEKKLSSTASKNESFKSQVGASSNEPGHD